MNTHAMPTQFVAAGRKPAVRFEALDSWRGIAAIMVVLFHAQIVSSVQAWHLVRSGEMFVDFFFVLSGFVIAHAQLGKLTAPAQLGRFLFLRIGRLYPLHLFMLLLFVVMELAKARLPFLANPADPAFSGTNEPSYLLSNLLLLQSLWPADSLSWNTPAWSISAEFVAYALFGGALLMPRRLLPPMLALTAILSLAVLASFADHGMQSTVRFGVLRALHGFSLGALAYLFAHRRILGARRRAHRGRGAGTAWNLAETAVVAIVLATVIFGHNTGIAFAAPLIFTLAVCVFAVERGYVSRLLTTRPLLLLGTLSYSIYMIHLFVQLRMTNLARLSDRLLDTSLLRGVGRTARYGVGIDPGNRLLGDLMMVAMVLVTVALSYLTWRFVEKPGQELFRRWSRRLFG